MTTSYLRTIGIAIGVAIALVAVPSAARADSDDDWAAVTESKPSRSWTERERRPALWYGWQTLLVDGVSFATVLGGAAGRSGGVASIGFAGAMLGGPIVHLGHGRGGIAAIDLLARAAFLGTGFVVGYGAAGACPADEQKSFGGCYFHGWSEALTGLALGYAAAVALDAGALAWEYDKNDPRAAKAKTPEPFRAALTPMVDPTTRGVGLGLGGAL